MNQDPFDAKAADFSLRMKVGKALTQQAVINLEVLKILAPLASGNVTLMGQVTELASRMQDSANTISEILDLETKAPSDER